MFDQQSAALLSIRDLFLKQTNVTDAKLLNSSVF